jgi:hypothetical protein
VKARRSKTLNKKSKYLSARLQFLLHVQSVQNTTVSQKTMGNFKNLNRKFRKMIAVNLQDIDSKIRKKCINLSYDLQDMNSADRLAFMYEDPSFPRNEKILMINTCISVMEQIEAYEVCATLDRMRQYMQRQVFA